jgi:hypothetical protein
LQRFVSFIIIVGRDPDPAHCLAATAPIAQGGRHVYAAEKAAVTRLAFSSCLWTESVLANPSAAEQFWTDVRNITHSCSWRILVFTLTRTCGYSLGFGINEVLYSRIMED